MKKYLIPIIILVLVAGAFIWRAFSTTQYVADPNQPAEPNQPNEPNPTEPTTPSEPTPKPPLEPVDPPEVSAGAFKLITLTTDKPGAELTAAVGRANVATILALNRIDDKHLYTGITISIPATIGDEAALDVAAAFLPETIEAASTIPKLAIVSQRVQAFGFYEFGKLVRSGPVSSGKQSTPTPNRLYFANWKGKEVVSTFSDEWILKWNFNVANFEGIGLHHYAMPGYPASHSCVRFYEPDAEFLYNWGDQWVLDSDGQTKLANGMPVIIFGNYAFGKTAPWKALATDPKATTITQTEIEKLVNDNLETIQKEQQKREQVLAARASAQ
ncbi:MAG: L,D-transpeptidase family protein [Candidatus Pacebacteria bacterium]|nr:L,D-transpeptidase family protein [Candidatus Paceibacterota bacterium]